MSAIYGIWNLNGNPVEEKFLQEMREEVSQYGRDGQDLLFEQNIGLGCCLSRCGIFSKADIPAYTDEQFILVCDALIYNRAELCEEYALGNNESVSTQILLLEAYKKWGKDCPKYINGDFAFAVWDKQKQHLFIARDHLGVRPLYYFHDQSTFAFATDYRSLLALPFIGKEIDEKTLYAHLAKILNFDAEATCFKNIKALPQSCALQINKQGIQKNKYWTPGRNHKIVYKTEEEYAKALYAIVKDAILIRLCHTEKKIASELSGGLDSSVITILASRELAKKGQKPMLFSWSPPFDFIGKLPNDERVLLQQVCQQEALDCTFFDPTIPLNNNAEILPPDVADAAVIRQEREIMASRGVSYILSGWGGDQGISHRANLFELFLTGYWGHFLKEIRSAANGSPLWFMKLLIYNTVYQLFKPYGGFGRSDKDVMIFIDKRLEKKMKRKTKKEILYFSISPVKHIESGYIQSRTETAAWMDADYSVQHLYPFLDYRVVDFAMSIPRHYYYKNGTSRYIYRQAFRDILPKEIYRFTSKNDIAKSTYFTDKLTDIISNMKKVADMLDRDVFSGYIDFDQLHDMLDHMAPDDKKNILAINRRILFCYRMQQILEEMRKTD